MLSYEQLAQHLASLMAANKLAQLEDESRQALAQHRFFLWHMYLIVALLRSGRREEAERELDDLMSYKFNLAERAFPEIMSAFAAKFDQHYILDTMKPGTAFEVEGAVRRSWAVPYPLAAEAPFAEAVGRIIDEAVPGLPALSRTTAVSTFGSCFAANLARLLKSAGVDATNLLIEESINSPMANRAFLEALARPGSSGYVARLTEVYGAVFLERARTQLARAQVVVLTLGVAPAFFYTGTSQFAFLEDYRALLKTNAVYMRTPGVEEAKRTISEMIDFLRELNPGARIYASVSPVPLAGTAELSNAVLADCVSKSTLRAAIHETLQDRGWKDVYYWPSFEVVRWLGAHTALPAFGADDSVSRHVSNWLVELIVDQFSRHLFGAPPAARTSTPVTTQAPGSRWSPR